MRIKLEGKWVCSVCWSDWEIWHGLKNDEPPQCKNCGALKDDPYGVDEERRPMLNSNFGFVNKKKYV